MIRTLVREVLTQYPFDVMYFDGPYQGMNNAREFCHCKYCEAAYQKRFGKPVPDQERISDDVVIHGVDGQRGGHRLSARDSRDDPHHAGCARSVQRYVAAEQAGVAESRHPGGGRLHVRSGGDAGGQAVQPATRPLHRQGDLDLRRQPHGIQSRAHEERSRARVVQLSGGESGTADRWRDGHRGRRGNRVLGVEPLLLHAASAAGV